jgi:hypothetical protein
VNADNAELVVLSDTGQMVIVTSADVLLEDTVVDENGFVSFEEEPVGLIDFATDGDGQRRLFWLSLTGNVVRVSGFTGEPSVTNSVPSDYVGVPCDACPFWDDPAVCEAPDDEPPPTINLCGVDVPIAMAMSMMGLGAMSLTRHRWYHCRLSIVD